MHISLRLICNQNFIIVLTISFKTNPLSDALKCILWIYAINIFMTALFSETMRRGNSDAFANYEAQDENAITWSLPFKILFPHC